MKRRASESREQPPPPQARGSGGGPMVMALLSDGPLAGTRTQVEAVEGRPPKTIDLDGPGDARSRYCLAGWEQSGHSATYAFLYEV